MAKLVIVSFLLFLVFLFLPTTNYQLPTTFAQTSSCGSTTPARSTGLITTPSLSGKFGTTGACIIDSKATFAPFKIPTYDDLKSIYYTQSKANKPAPITSLPSTIADQTVYLVNGDLTITSTPSGSGTAIVFVEGQLTINSNYTYGTATSGTVFVVRGNVNILQTVTRMDAVIISSGTICTAYDGTFCPTIKLTSPLVINGSFISLDSAKPIRFRRTLTDNTAAAEVINHQVKYLVILRNILSDTLQKWSEVAGNEPFLTPGPSVTLTPPPSPTPTPTPTVITSAATSITATSATLNGSANPNGGATSGYFRYSTTNPGSCNNTFGTRIPATGGTSLGSGTTAISYSQSISSLSASTTYYFCAIASNTGGTGFGLILSFTTSAPPCTPTTWYRDADVDGYGNPVVTTSSCTKPAGYVSNNSDCYDVVGGATTVCDGVTKTLSACAYPGQDEFFATNRGDGSFDYDCSGSITYILASRLFSPPGPVSRITGVISCGGLNCTEPLTPSMCGVNQGYSGSDSTCFTCSPQTRSGLWTTDTLKCK